MIGDLRINLNGPQTRAFKLLQPGNTVAIPWGRGIGKSWFLRTVCYLLVAQWDGVVRPSVETADGLATPDGPGIRIVILMPTLAQFKKVHLTLLEQEITGRWKFLGGVLNKTDFKVSFPGGSWIQVVSAEVAQGSRGIRCDVVLPDEADDIDPEVVESVTQPWFTEPHSLRITMIGGTPKRGRYGLLWRAHNDWPKDPLLAATHFSIHATCYDAPKHVDRHYIDTEIKPKTSTAIWRREYLCDFDSAEGLVYPMFLPSFHVRAPDYGVPYSEILVGVDHGFEDPGVILVAGVIGNGKDAIVHLLEEVYEQHHESGWWDEKAAEVAGRYLRYQQRWYADPSRPDRVQGIKKRCREVHGDRLRMLMGECDNGIEPGVAAVADRIAIRDHDPERPGEAPTRSSRFYVAPECVNTIREFGLYRRKRDPRNQERVLDDILDRDNHTQDSLRYLTVSRFGRPVNSRHELNT